MKTKTPLMPPTPTGNFKVHLLIIVLFASAITANGQNDLKNWNAAHLNLSFTKKLDLRLGYLQAYNLKNRFSKDFGQYSANVSGDITKRISVSAGTVLGSVSTTDGSNRFTLRGTYKTSIANVLSWSNSIQGEVHSPNETRYRYRGVYITRLATKKRLTFLKLSPSASYSLYYNIGGQPIQYYDKDGIAATRQTPDGFHRGRLSLNLNSKIARHLSFGVYYMMQREFNLLVDDYHKINVVNPATGKTTRRFNDYNVIGTTLSYDLNFFKK